MSDVYVIHASEDDIITGEIVALLEKHWDVWWDDALIGDFVKIVPQQMADTKCAVAIMSSHSTVKETVIDEMRLARDAGVAILPLMIDDTKLPYTYGSLSKIDFRLWDKSEGTLCFKSCSAKSASSSLAACPP